MICLRAKTVDQKAYDAQSLQTGVRMKQDGIGANLHFEPVEMEQVAEEELVNGMCLDFRASG